MAHVPYCRHPAHGRGGLAEDGEDVVVRGRSVDLGEQFRGVAGAADEYGEHDQYGLVGVAGEGREVLVGDAEADEPVEVDDLAWLFAGPAAVGRAAG